MLFQYPLLQPLLILVQRQIPVRRGFLRQRVAVDGIVRVYQLIGRQRSAAFLALVAVSTLRMTPRTLPADVTVGQKLLCLRVVELLRRLLNELTIVVQLAEIVRRKLMMGLARGARIYIERDTKLLKRRLYQLVVSVHHLLRGDTLFAGADGNGHAVLIASAHKKHLLAFQTEVPHINICGHIHPRKVSDMHRPVRIRQCRCYKCSLKHILI